VIGTTRDALGQIALRTLGVTRTEARLEERVVEDEPS